MAWPNHVDMSMQRYENTVTSDKHLKATKAVTYIMDHDVEHVRHVADGSLYTGLGYQIAQRWNEGKAVSTVRMSRLHTKGLNVQV